MPFAIFAIKSAVAGATTIKFAFLASLICGTSWTLFQRFSLTLLPDKASHVAEPTKFKLALVGITETPKPMSCNLRSKSADL